MWSFVFDRHAGPNDRLLVVLEIFNGRRGARYTTGFSYNIASIDEYTSYVAVDKQSRYDRLPLIDAVILPLPEWRDKNTPVSFRDSPLLFSSLFAQDRPLVAPSDGDVSPTALRALLSDGVAFSAW
jgi:hypothetical protein